jgi:chemotaxis regulatin CheY-phosphate phosphatase CheZ
MADQQKIETTDENGDTVTHDELKSKLAVFEKFVARRFDEISMEINATSQLLDMAEDGAEQRFNDMVNALSKINDLGDGDSAANSGAQLEAAVFEAEAAATKILDSCEQISGLIEQTTKVNTSDDVTSALEHIDSYVQEILMACSFQDLVGQRIRTALAELKGVESELTETLSSMGINMAPEKEDKSKPSSESISPSSTQASQDDIDALFD